MGSKDRYIEDINRYIHKSNKKIYVEPFLGGGSIFLNLYKNFDYYFLSEKDENLINIYKHAMDDIKENEFSLYFKNISKNYKVNTYNDFYSFRDYFNNTLWKSNTKEEAFALIILSTICINNMYRFGKNGFNQSFGNGFLTDMKIKRIENTFKYLSQRKNSIVIENDYKKVLNINDALYFCDPPYYKANMANSSNWGEEDTKYLLNSLNYKDNDILYTDIENESGNNIFKYKQKLSMLKNISPNRKIETVHNEILYSTFKIKNNFLS